MWWENHPDQEYEYQHAGIVERHGEVPLGFLIAAGILFVWGLLQVILGWAG